MPFPNVTGSEVCVCIVCTLRSRPSSAASLNDTALALLQYSSRSSSQQDFRLKCDVVQAAEIGHQLKRRRVGLIASVSAGVAAASVARRRATRVRSRLATGRITIARDRLAVPTITAACRED